MKTTDEILENLRNTSDITENTADPIIKVNSAHVTETLPSASRMLLAEE